MEAKGKVVSVSKGWDDMYPAMHSSSAPSKARVEIELDGKAGRVNLELPAKEAREYAFGAEVTVTVTKKSE